MSQTITEGLQPPPETTETQPQPQPQQPQPQPYTQQPQPQPHTQQPQPSSSQEKINTIDQQQEFISKEKRFQQRKIIAEDVEWNLAPVEKLTSLCIKIIVENFEKSHVLDGIPLKYREMVISNISTDLPLSITALLIPDETYWKRLSKEKFKNCDHFSSSWKRLFFERYIESLLEIFTPNMRITDDQEVNSQKRPLDLKAFQLSQQHGGSGANKPPQGQQQKEMQVMMLNREQANKTPLFVDTGRLVMELKLSSGFVRRLDVKQLRPMEPPEGHVANPTDPPPNHIDMSMIFGNLVNLEDISLYYGVLDCGINFNWNLFGMTLKDCISLCNNLKTKAVMKTLKSLKILSSGIDDDRARLIASALLDNETLTHLDLSHNQISDSGARGFAKVLSNPKSNLQTLLLANNKISASGIHSIGKSLASGQNSGQNTRLHTLNVRLNRIGDEGGGEFFNLLSKNDTIQTLDLSANGLGKATVATLCFLIRKNGKKLRNIDVSCNKFGTVGIVDLVESPSRIVSGNSSDQNRKIGSVSSETSDEAGKMLFEAVSHNKYISTLDLRMTDIPADYITAIQGIVVENEENFS